MPGLVQDHTLLNGLSDFWQRFFADSDQLQAMYKGMSSLIGQAYLDLCSNVLNLSLQDALVFQKEYWKLLTIREDQVSYAKGQFTSDDRWKFDLPEGLIDVHLLENKVFNPTVSLQEKNDFDVSSTALLFKQDPTDPNLTGVPLQGFAMRQTDVVIGGQLDDTAKSNGWVVLGIRKGDKIRLLDVRLATQTKISDHSIVLVRKDKLSVSSETPFLSASTAKFVILRKTYDSDISLEPLTFSGSPATATLTHTRVEHGSLHVYAKSTAPGHVGEDVVEGRDYQVDYEGGKIVQIIAFDGSSVNKADYSWRQEVYPFTTTGVTYLTTSTRVSEIAIWAPDVLVDRDTLYLNFGSMIGEKQKSSEAYRAFLRGIFQLYILGPVLERIESALNVVLGLPVIRDDGELLINYDNTDPLQQIVTTLRVGGSQASYFYPKTAPLRSDVIDPSSIGILTFRAFEHITTAATVEDYIQDPEWYFGQVIPEQLFSITGTATIPSTARRTVSPFYYQNVLDPDDDECVGDPGFVIGCDEEGNPSQWRRKMAFVVFDRFLKYHTFICRFDSSIFLDQTAVEFEHTPDELAKLVLNAKPAYTYPFLQPATFFIDEVLVEEMALAVFPVQSFVNNVLFTDRDLLIDTTGWLLGDYEHYEIFSESKTFTTIGVPVALGNTPGAPRTARLTKATLDGAISGKRLVENVDYTVDYVNRTVTRQTAWTSNTCNVSYIQINIGNIINAPADATVGDYTLAIGRQDPEILRNDYPTRLDPFGSSIPSTAEGAYDISLVESVVNIIVS